MDDDTVGGNTEKNPIFLSYIKIDNLGTNVYQKIVLLKRGKNAFLIVLLGHFLSSE